ncbi:MAG: divergent polysaccharide deacetylase family protein [Desulfobacterales bacterium]|jgi:polysaccharide deacetylase 2 family uncharacterized protein YibQ
MANTRKSPTKKPSAARKRQTKPTRPRRRKAKTPLGLTLAKMAGVLCILVVVVTAAGLIAHFLLRGADGPTPSGPKRPAVAKSPPVVYEVYPKTIPSKPPIRKKASPTPSQPSKARSSASPSPPAVRPKVAIIIDDIGYDQGLAEAFMALHVPLTFSVLPESPFLVPITRQLKKKGYEIMLHLPMEPNEYPDVDPGPGALLSQMPPDELIARLNRHLDRLPGIKGVNNHMGSRLTADSSKIYQVFTVLKKRGLYFVDSRSTAETVAMPSARLFQLPFAERDVFLDHLQEADFIRKQFKELAAAAEKQGEAVGIAHPHALTIAVFKSEIPKLQQRVRLVPASEVVHILP